jgi:hypothetical protein
LSFSVVHGGLLRHKYLTWEAFELIFAHLVVLQTRDEQVIEADEADILHRKIKEEKGENRH